MGRGRLSLLAALLVAALMATAVALANVSLTKVSTDPYSNTTSQHQTEVEPDTFSNGSTIVATFQVGRFYDGGASNIGWATSTNSGSSWTSGFLPGITTFASPAGSYDRVSDPSVAYDARHLVWLINSLPLLNGGGVTGAAIVVSRSTNGGTTWNNPVTVATATGNSDFDKNWIACDNTSSSAFYGRCYVEWDDFQNGNQVHVAYSSDGGLTWTQGSLPSLSVLGGQPVVQPNGKVVMPIDNGSETSLMSLVSTNGGVSWTGPYTIASLTSHAVAGNLRTDALPSAEVDGAGKVYVVWQDCRFRSRCKSNDIVMSTSTDGQAWSAVTRIPIDSVSSGADHFLPGIGVDRSTSGTGAHLGLVYHFYPVARCGSRRNNTCQLDVGFVSSTNGGSTWSSPTQLAGPMTLSWLPNTNQGRMVGDYVSTSFSGGNAFSVFAVANTPTSGGSDCATATPNCDQGMYAPAALSATGGPFGSSDLPVANAASDHASPRAGIFR